jgi:excisionase family DNA binding protein
MTTQTPGTANLPRLAFRVGEAAVVLGVSPDFFDRHISGELRWVRRGALKLVSLSELQRWLDANASRVLDDLEGRA